MKSTSIFIVTIFVTLICVIIILGLYAMHEESSSTITIIDTAKVDWLPISAKNVSRKIIDDSSNYEDYIECIMPEGDFLILAKRKWITLKTESTSAFSGISNNPKLVDISNGYKAESRGANGGGYTVIYDRDQHHMYYYWCSR